MGAAAGELLVEVEEEEEEEEEEKSIAVNSKQLYRIYLYCNSGSMQ